MNRKLKSSIWGELWFEYRSELFFGVVLAALVALSYWLATYIPEDVFENIILPIQYIASVFVCLGGALLLLRHHDGIVIRKSWAAILLVWGVLDVILFVFRFGFHISAIGSTPNNPLYNATVTLGNLLAWFLFIYPTQVLRPGWLNWWRALLLLMPIVLLELLDYYVDADLLPLIMIYPALIFITLCTHVRKYRLWCEDNFSSMDKIDAQWIVRYLTILAILGVSFYFISFCYIPNRMFTQNNLLFFMLAYATEQILFRPDPFVKAAQSAPDYLSRNETVSDGVEPAQDAPDSLNQGANAANSEVVALSQWMDNDKPYRNPEFQLMDLRAVLPMNRTYLSNFINSHYSCSFFHWVNHYRVEEAKRLMKAHPDMKLSDIAAQCGFSSPAVFSRTFARETGMSPTAWNKE